ncbi:cobyrinic acid a,c-diamide synthase [Halobacterium noricense]
MGLYDGEQSSTARVADVLDLPVVLVVDASAGMESVAATALGFREYALQIGGDIDVAGILAQRAHGGRHERGVREALPDELEYFGRIPPISGLKIPDRHLGLQMGEENSVERDALDKAAEHVRTNRLLDIAREPSRPSLHRPNPARNRRVAVARDKAFRFIYPAVLERLRARSEVVTFAPTAGDELPDCDGVYLPGGYPELHAEQLADAPSLSTLSERASDGLPIFGECGGLMALAESLITTSEQTYSMAGVLPADVRMHERYQALDHVELRGCSTTLGANRGRTIRGHEFHYSSADVASDASFAFDVVRGTGIDGEHDGLTEFETVGTYCHVHAASGAFDAFIDSL